MAGDVQVTISGDDALQAGLRQMQDDVMRTAPADAARALETEAGAAAPRRTGRLAGSFNGRTESGRVVLTSDARYARPVAARTGFLAQALRAAGPDLERAYATDLQRQCDRVHNRG